MDKVREERMSYYDDDGSNAVSKLITEVKEGLDIYVKMRQTILVNIILRRLKIMTLKMIEG